MEKGKKIEKQNILVGLLGKNHHFFLSHLVPDAMRQLLRPVQPIKLTKMSRNVRGHSSLVGEQ